MRDREGGTVWTVTKARGSSFDVGGLEGLVGAIARAVVVRVVLYALTALDLDMVYKKGRWRKLK